MEPRHVGYSKNDIDFMLHIKVRFVFLYNIDTMT